MAQATALVKACDRHLCSFAHSVARAGLRTTRIWPVLLNAKAPELTVVFKLIIAGLSSLVEESGDIFRLPANVG